MIRMLAVPEELRSRPSAYPEHSTTGIEQYFYQFAERRLDLQTTLPYLPIFWTANYFGQQREERSATLHAVQRAQQVLDSLAGLSCFTVVQADEIYEHVPASVTVFGAGGDGHIPIPLLTDPCAPSGRARDVLCSFVGAVEVGGAGARIRRRMMALMTGRPGFEMHARPWQNTPEWYASPHCVNGQEYVRSYRDLLSRSIFTLCPRGYGPTSFRLYEAIQTGSIPVYIADEFWLPFTDELDWTAFALIVHEDDLPAVPDLIGGMSASTITRMQERLAEVAATHFNLESACERIVAAVNRLSFAAAGSVARVWSQAACPVEDVADEAITAG